MVFSDASGDAASAVVEQGAAGRGRGAYRRGDEGAGWRGRGGESGEWRRVRKGEVEDGRESAKGRGGAGLPTK